MSALDKSETAANPAQKPEASQSNLFSEAFDKGLTAIQEHKVEAAAVGTAALAAAAIVLSRGRVLGGLVREGVEVEAGSFATSSAKALAPGGKIADQELLASLKAGKENSIRSVSFPPGATEEKKAALLYKNAHSGPDVFKDVLDARPLKGDGLGTLGATKDAGRVARGLDPLAPYDKSAYQMVPARTMANSIRLAEGPTMSTVDGPSGIVFGSDNSIQSISFSAGSTAAERAALILKGAYA
ncbi:MAG: hypothetical protein JSS86_22705, partial [Cyanobacteria bacterium SZAS LIN-2]|nr:hypothetical protein [Cyanobacteria bacterium SZAS LIN-2]